MALGGLSAGLFQTFVVRAFAPRAWLWVLVSLLGWTLARSMVAISDQLLPKTTGVVGALQYVGVILAGGGVLGAVSAAALGAVIPAQPTPLQTHEIAHVKSTVRVPRRRVVGQIADRVASARSGESPLVIARLPSGWAVMGDVQFLPGYCLLLADPVVSSLNDLIGPARRAYLDDMGCLGDAVLEVTRARRINYEILGNLEPELHAHVFPRYAHEPEALRSLPVWFYDWKSAAPYAEAKHGVLRAAIREALGDAVRDPRQ